MDLLGTAVPQETQVDKNGTVCPGTNNTNERLDQAATVATVLSRVGVGL